MGKERTPLMADWMACMHQAMRDREATIISGVLQQPDYPPLPECPTCLVAPDRITTRTEDPSFGQDGTPVLVDFAPCGHGFRVSSEELLRS